MGKAPSTEPGAEERLGAQYPTAGTWIGAARL